MISRTPRRRSLILIDANPGASLHEFEPEQFVPVRQGLVLRGSREVEIARLIGHTLQHIEQFSSCALPLDTKLVAELEARGRKKRSSTPPQPRSVSRPRSGFNALLSRTVRCILVPRSRRF